MTVGSPSWQRLRRKLVREGTVVLVSRGVAGVTGLAIVGLVTRILPIEAVGAYFLAFSAFVFLRLILAFGLEDLGLRMVASAKIRDGARQVGRVVRRLLSAATWALAVFFALGLTGIIALAGLGFLPSGFSLLGIVLILFWGASAAYRMILSGIFRGIGQVIVSNACAFLAAEVLTAGLLVAYWLLGGPGQLDDVLGIAAGASVAATLLTFVLLRRFVQEPLWSRHLERPGEILGSAVPIAATKFLSITVLQGSLWIVAGLGNVTEVALYGASLRVAQSLGVMHTVSNAIGAPHVVALDARGATQALARMSQGLSLASLGPPLVLLGVLLVVGSEFVALMFGPVFAASAEPLLILMLGRVVQIGCGNGRTLLIMTGHQRALAWIDAMTATAALLGSFAGYSLAGVNGAAAGVAVSLAVGGALGAATVKRRLGFWPLAPVVLWAALRRRVLPRLFQSRSIPKLTQATPPSREA